MLPGLFSVGRVGVCLGLGFLQENFSGWFGGFVWLGNSIRGNNGVAGIRGVDVGLGLGAGVSAGAGVIPYRAVAGSGCWPGWCAPAGVSGLGGALLHVGERGGWGLFSIWWVV